MFCACTCTLCLCCHFYLPCGFAGAAAPFLAPPVFGATPDATPDAAAEAAGPAASALLFEPCPLKTRVGENSPNRWPTMFSVIYTEINFLPLCTSNVCPIISGSTIDLRDHVFTDFFNFVWFIFTTLSYRWWSTNGPFLNDLAILFPLRYFLRSLTIHRLDFLFDRVRYPFVYMAQGV